LCPDEIGDDGNENHHGPEKGQEALNMGEKPFPS